MTSGKKFLDPRSLAEAAKQVADMAKAEGVKVVLVGGFALQLYGSDRLTGDLDFIGSSTLDGLPRGKTLSFGGQQTKAPNGVPVDIIVRNDDYVTLYDAALERTHRIKGCPVDVVRPEWLAAMKLASGRTKDDADLEFLIASKKANIKVTRTVVRAHLGAYAAEDFDRVVQEVTWKAATGRL